MEFPAVRGPETFSFSISKAHISILYFSFILPLKLAKSSLTSYLMK